MAARCNRSMVLGGSGGDPPLAGECRSMGSCQGGQDALLDLLLRLGLPRPGATREEVAVVLGQFLHLRGRAQDLPDRGLLVLASVLPAPPQAQPQRADLRPQPRPAPPRPPDEQIIPLRRRLPL